MLHRIHKKQWIKNNIIELWEFINNPQNNVFSIPALMRFKAVSELKNKKI